MRKCSFISLVVVILLFGNSLATQKDVEEGKLEDVVITGEDKLKVGGKKPLLFLGDDIDDVISPYMQTEKELLFKTFPTPLPKMEKITYLSNPLVASPYLQELISPPVATFCPKSEAKELISSWELVITDHKGREFRKYSGVGAPPEAIKWDGRSEEGEIASVGTTYTYVFTYIDIVGRSHTIIGEPFSFKGLVHQEEKGLVISLANKAVFNEMDGRVEIREESFHLLKDVVDEITSHPNNPIMLEVYAGEINLARKRGEAFLQYLTNQLSIPKDEVKISAYKASKDKERIDVIILNR